MSSPRWRLLTTPPMRGAENMALDEALMARARLTGEWVLRVYEWSEPTVSFGRNQSALGRYDAERIRARGLAAVRRPTGGRAILHDREITYSVTGPEAAAGILREAYERINGILLDGLARLGVSAGVAAAAGHAPRPTAAPCFAEPSAGELTFEGRKLAGSAQWRSDGALLQHGSILVGDDQHTLLGLMNGAPDRLAHAATLTAALGRAPEATELAEALAAAVRELEDPAATSWTIDDESRARMAALVVRYLDDGWTWRR